MTFPCQIIKKQNNELLVDEKKLNEPTHATLSYVICKWTLLLLWTLCSYQSSGENDSSGDGSGKWWSGSWWRWQLLSLRGQTKEGNLQNKTKRNGNNFQLGWRKTLFEEYCDLCKQEERTQKQTLMAKEMRKFIESIWLRWQLSIRARKTSWPI